jgi:DNA-nicking Smr family endonuclease
MELPSKISYATITTGDGNMHKDRGAILKEKIRDILSPYKTIIE